MSIHKAISAGLVGNEISKKITGTDEVSAGRTAVATGSGAAVGAVSAGTITVGIAAAEAVGLVAAGTVVAPIAIPLCVAGGVIAAIASLFD